MHLGRGHLGGAAELDRYGLRLSMVYYTLARIDLPDRTAQFACSPTLSEAAARFHPLFLYESLSGLLGAVVAAALALNDAVESGRLKKGNLILLTSVDLGALRGDRADRFLRRDAPDVRVLRRRFGDWHDRDVSAIRP